MKVVICEADGGLIVRRKYFTLIFFTALFFSPRLFAYNFLYIHPTEGRPIGWDNTKTIQYYLDPGKLGRLTNDQAHTLLKEAMKIWENASPNANVPKFEFMGYLDEDVDGGNYEKYVSKSQCYTEADNLFPNGLDDCPSQAQKDLKTVIVFDEDDSILNNELCKIGGCSANAGAKVFNGSSSDPQSIAQGIAVFGGGLAGSSTTKINIVVGLMVHELGHLLGLAHTSINEEAIIKDLAGYGRYSPTMYASEASSSNLNPAQSSADLNPDDVAGISTLYPSDQFSQNTGTITGQILKSDGSPMMHVNVLARNINDPLCEAYSFLSGRICPEGLHTVGSISGGSCYDDNGDFVPTNGFLIKGLSPGDYTIEVEEVADDLLGRGLAPGLVPSEDIFGDAEFWNSGDTINESNTAFTPIKLVSGQTVSSIDMMLNRSEVTDDRIQFIPLVFFTPGPGTSCPSIPTVDYSKLIGIEEVGGSSSGATSGTTESGGCGLIVQ